MQRLRWLFSRRVGWALAWISLVIAAAVLVNLVGIEIVGNTEAWSQWLDHYAALFFFWRLCLYGLTGWGWLWMCRRLLAREASPEIAKRLVRTEIAAVLAILLLEGSTLLRSV